MHIARGITRFFCTEFFMHSYLYIKSCLVLMVNNFTTIGACEIWHVCNMASTHLLFVSCGTDRYCRLLLMLCVIFEYLSSFFHTTFHFYGCVIFDWFSTHRACRLWLYGFALKGHDVNSLLKNIIPNLGHNACFAFQAYACLSYQFYTGDQNH